MTGPRSRIRAGFWVSQECVLLPLGPADGPVSHVITYGKVLSTLEQTHNRR